MPAETERPCGLAGRHGRTTETIDTNIIGDRSPICKLHAQRLVDTLPEGCPLAAANPLVGVQCYESRGYQRLDRFADLTGGLSDLRRAEICFECVGRWSRHPHVRRLRSTLEVSPHAA